MFEGQPSQNKAQTSPSKQGSFHPWNHRIRCSSSSSWTDGIFRCPHVAKDGGTLEWCFDGEKPWGEKQKTTQNGGGAWKFHDDVLQKIIQFLTLFSNAGKETTLARRQKRHRGNAEVLTSSMGQSWNRLEVPMWRMWGAPHFFRHKPAISQALTAAMQMLAYGGVCFSDQETQFFFEKQMHPSSSILVLKFYR